MGTEKELSQMIASLRSLQEIEIPDSFKLIKHDFYAYDPTTEFTEIENLMYLNEDLFQVSYAQNDLLIDLGWYGDVRKNNGQFQIQLIQNNHWDEPISTIHAKSLSEATEILSRTLSAIHDGVFND